MVTGTRAGTGSQGAVDAGRPILVDGAEHLAHAGEPRRLGAAREERRDPRARHREPRRTEVVERVAEGVDAALVHEGDGAGAGHREVAAHQGGADGVARLERGARWPRGALWCAAGRRRHRR